MPNRIIVHSDEACGEGEKGFTQLSRIIQKQIRNGDISDAKKQLETCKKARLESAYHHGGMDERHIPPYNLVDYLLICIIEIDKTTGFAEDYKGGKTHVTYKEPPMSFILMLDFPKGSRVFTITANGYDFEDRLK
jgi:hypothetical protein